MNEIINKTDGTILKWSKTTDNNYFCLLYSDNKNNYSFTPTANLNCKLFMIGGGGAGGYYFGGGGGAGAAYYNENFTFKKGITYNFNIGNGGKCDIDDFNTLFSKGISLNIYNNVNIDFNNISFSLDDYSSLNINNSGLLQTFNVNNNPNNDNDTEITIPSSIWNNNTFYIWSGYIIPTTNDEYIKITVNTNINTAIWIDNYIYKNENALILNTNNNYLNDVKIIKIDPNRYYNIKIIAYSINNSSNNNFSVNFSNNCSLVNYNKNNEKYIYLNATDTTLNFNDPSLDNPINTFICNGGGNGGCGFYNQNNNLDGGCGGGSGINKKNGNSIVNTNIYKGTNGNIGTFCGGGGGIMTSGKDNIGGDGIILNWFDNKLFFGCGGNGGNYKDNRNYGYGCGGNGGDCCYYSKEIINNNGKNGCVLIYINPISQPLIEHFTTSSTSITNTQQYPQIEEFYNYIISTDTNGLDITKVYMNSIYTITDVITENMYGFNTKTPFYDTTELSAPKKSTTYAGCFTKSTGTTEPSLSTNTNTNTIQCTNGTYNKADWTDGVDIFFNYFKYNPIYIYDILCLHRTIIALYKIMYYNINNNVTIDYNTLNIVIDDNSQTSQTYQTGFTGNNTIKLVNIFSPDKINFTTTTTGNGIITSMSDYINVVPTDFYTSANNGMNINTDILFYNNYDVPPMPYYYLLDNSNNITNLMYIKDYLENDFINRYSNGSSPIRDKSFINGIFTNISINKANVDDKIR